MINSSYHHQSPQSTIVTSTPSNSCHKPFLAHHPLYTLPPNPQTEQTRPPQVTPPPKPAKLFSQTIDDLSNIFQLPHHRRLENECIIRQLPLGHPLRPFYLDVVAGTDNVPLLSMSEDEEHRTGGGGEAGRGPVTPGRKAKARAKVNDLAESIPGETLPGGKSFDQLPLYEKKSVLINRELEYVVDYQGERVS